MPIDDIQRKQDARIGIDKASWIRRCGMASIRRRLPPEQAVSNCISPSFAIPLIQRNIINPTRTAWLSEFPDPASKKMTIPTAVRYKGHVRHPRASRKGTKDNNPHSAMPQQRIPQVCSFIFASRSGFPIAPAQTGSLLASSAYLSDPS